jgi:acyl carrier protein
MEDRKIQRNLYRVLRKTGVKKKVINLNSTFAGDMKFDETDWTVFIYYLEGTFNITVSDEELVKLENIRNTIQFLGKTA